jgi:hypothetical protein
MKKMGEILETDVILTPIPSSKGLSNYLADTINGRIFSKISNRYLTTKPNSNDYVYNAVIFDDGTKSGYCVSRLVYSSYSGIEIENFKRGSIEVDHVAEEEKWNNRIDNLQMSSRKLQYKESTRAKMGKGRRLKESEVVKILEQLKEWKSDVDNKVSDFIHSTAEVYGQGYRNVWNIVNGKSWKYLYSEMGL